MYAWANFLHDCQLSNFHAYDKVNSKYCTCIYLYEKHMNKSQIFHNRMLFPLANLFEFLANITELDKYCQETTFNKIHYQRPGLKKTA